MKQLKELALPEKYEQVMSIMQSKSVKDLTCHILAQYITTVHACLLHQYCTLNTHGDLTQPHEWFPKAQGHITLQKLMLHASPTNSGKTHQALMQLEQAE